MEELEKNKYLKQIEKFFRNDLLIKKAMYESAYNDSYGLDIDSLTKYSDYLSKVLEYIQALLEEMVNHNEYEVEQLKNKFSKYKEELINCGLNREKLRQFYEKNISNMSEELVDKVSKNCVAYGCGGMSLSPCESINEILHTIHQRLINNEYLYQKLPKIEEKQNNKKFSIVLYGDKESKLARELYDNFPLDIEVGWTDILSIDDRVIMLIRDKGHALLVEINQSKVNENEQEVDYFIPKICNVQMVNELKGIIPVSQNGQYARGMFNVSNEVASNTILELIRKVPTDKDIPTYGDFRKNL